MLDAGKNPAVKSPVISRKTLFYFLISWDFFLSNLIILMYSIQIMHTSKDKTFD